MAFTPISLSDEKFDPESLAEELAEEEIRLRGGSARKKRPSNSKTSVHARQLAIESSQEDRVGDAKKGLEKYLLQHPALGDNEHAEGKFLSQYVPWVNRYILDEAMLLGDDVVRVRFSKSGGPGGQNVNKVSSRVSAEHIITGITAASNTSRDQSVNRGWAMDRLQKALLEHLSLWRIYLQDGDSDAKPRELIEDEVLKLYLEAL